MDMVSSTYFDGLKRYWKRRKYGRLDDTKKRVKTARLGNNQRRGWKIRIGPKMKFQIALPMKLVTKIHCAYVNMMIRLMRDKDNAVFCGKGIPKKGPVPMVATYRNEIVDGRLVMEIYKRLVSSRQQTPLLV